MDTFGYLGTAESSSGAAREGPTFVPLAVAGVQALLVVVDFENDR
jgi:hypothetical protein